MRWSRRGADLLLQVRCAVDNGTLGSGFGPNLRQSPAQTSAPCNHPWNTLKAVVQGGRGCPLPAAPTAQDVTAHFPRSPLLGPAAPGRMSKSKMAVGT